MNIDIHKKIKLWRKNDEKIIVGKYDVSDLWY
jgi:hypothetical protein